MRGIWYGVLQGSLEGGVGKLFLQMSKWFTPSYLCAAFHLYWWKTDKNKQMKDQHPRQLSAPHKRIIRAVSLPKKYVLKNITISGLNVLIFV